MMAKQAPSNRRQVGGEHYLKKAVQPWEAMEAWMTTEQFKGYLLGNCIKYLARAQDKHESPLEDLLKCQHYLARLMEVVHDETHN